MPLLRQNILTLARELSALMDAHTCPARRMDTLVTAPLKCQPEGNLRGHPLTGDANNRDKIRVWL